MVDQTLKTKIHKKKETKQKLSTDSTKLPHQLGLDKTRQCYVYSKLCVLAVQVPGKRALSKLVQRVITGRHQLRP